VCLCHPGAVYLIKSQFTFKCTFKLAKRFTWHWYTHSPEHVGKAFSLPSHYGGGLCNLEETHILPTWVFYMYWTIVYLKRQEKEQRELDRIPLVRSASFLCVVMFMLLSCLVYHYVMMFTLQTNDITSFSCDYVYFMSLCRKRELHNT